MKLKSIFFLSLILGSQGFLSAQPDIPLLLPEERQALDEQSVDFNKAVGPVLQEVAKSTVRIWSGSKRLAYGTVVDDGHKVLTKWSEIARSQRPLRIDAGGDETRDVIVSGIYEDEDLAVLAIQGEPLTPVKWSFEVPKLGGFLVAPQPEGNLAAFGVVSVPSRNLRQTDLAYLGVGGDPEFSGQGVKIKDVAPDSGAQSAGLRPGNVILKVGERQISGLLELKNALTGTAPGQKVDLLVDVGGKEKKINVLLGSRPQMREYFGGRLQQMERMGGPISEVRDSFTQVLQTDMRPRPDQIGGPVADLKGRAIGITMARADRTRSFVMPASAIVELLKTPAGDPALAKIAKMDEEDAMAARAGASPDQSRRGRSMQGNESRMRRHLSDMERLMEHMRMELESLERP